MPEWDDLTFEERDAYIMLWMSQADLEEAISNGDENKINDAREEVEYWERRAYIFAG